MILIGFGEAGHRQRAVVGDQTAAGSLQARPAEAEDLRVGLRGVAVQPPARRHTVA